MDVTHLASHSSNVKLSLIESLAANPPAIIESKTPKNRFSCHNLQRLSSQLRRIKVHFHMI